MPAYYVLNSHTLGYVQPEAPNTFCVLHGNPLLGGLDWKNGPTVILDSDVLTPATTADFERFRVSPVGHLTP
jgi:hypothetical protein